LIRFKNKTKNTIYLEDLDRSIPYAGDHIQNLVLNDAKKSKAFQHFVEVGKFEIISSNKPSQLEKALQYRKVNYEKTMKEQKDCEKSITISDSNPVCVRGHIFDISGYGKVNRNLIFGLLRNGVNVCIDPTNRVKMQIGEKETRILAGLQRKPDHRKTIFIDSMVPTFGMNALGGYRILYTTVESTTIPKQFRECLAFYNEIWVTSDFCKRVLEKDGVEQKIMVLPDSIDTDHYIDKGDLYYFDPPLKDFVFVSVFSWNYRKGYDALLKAYLQEFSGDDPVTLLLVSKHFHTPNKNKDIKKEVAEFIKRYGGSNPPHIARCSMMISESQMPSLYRTCNAYISLTRGEGFGLTFCESALCGLPVIATDHSGQTMFMNEKNSTLVPIDGMRKVESGMMNVHYWDGQYFADLTTKDFIREAGQSMRYVFEHQEEAKAKTKLLIAELRENYSIDAVAKKAIARLNEIRSKNNAYFA